MAGRPSLAQFFPSSASVNSSYPPSDQKGTRFLILAVKWLPVNFPSYAQPLPRHWAIPPRVETSIVPPRPGLPLYQWVEQKWARAAAWAAVTGLTVVFMSIDPSDSEPRRNLRRRRRVCVRRHVRIRACPVSVQSMSRYMGS